VLDGLFVPLSPLLLHDEFHLPLCMFDNGGGDFDHIGREVRCASEGVFARPKFMDAVQSEDISNRDVIQSRDCQEVSGGQEVFFASDCSDGIL
jgi:hypothetical protein